MAVGKRWRRVCALAREETVCLCGVVCEVLRVLLDTRADDRRSRIGNRVASKRDARTEEQSRSRGAGKGLAHFVASTAKQDSKTGRISLLQEERRSQTPALLLIGRRESVVVLLILSCLRLFSGLRFFLVITADGQANQGSFFFVFVVVVVCLRPRVARPPSPAGDCHRVDRNKAVDTDSE